MQVRCNYFIIKLYWSEKMMKIGWKKVVFLRFEGLNGPGRPWEYDRRIGREEADKMVGWARA